jgi:phenylacetate-CoA ligase
MGTFNGKYTLERSSGHSGEPFFWLREPGEDRHLQAHTEFMFRDSFKAHQKSTLVVVTWSQGTWVTGEKFARVLRNLGSQGQLKVTVVSPGICLDETIEILKTFLPHFDQTIIAGYPPFIKDIVDEGKEQNIRWADHRVHVMSGGEGFPEGWRKYIADALGIQNINHADSPQIISCYGSADTGIGSGAETPFAQLVRILCDNDAGLCQDLFDSSSPPSIFQYDPTRLFAEEVDGELLFTYRSAIPLVRYNIHDRGGHLAYLNACKALQDHGYRPKEMLRELGWTNNRLVQVPLFYVFGRTDGTTTIYGVNVYTEDVHEALNQRDIVNLHTGEFRVRTVYDRQADQRLRIHVRLKPSTQPSVHMADHIRGEVLSTLVKRNNEFRHLHEAKGARVIPIVELTHEPLNGNGNGHHGGNGNGNNGQNNKAIKYSYV